jgi:hypothetical protein
VRDGVNGSIEDARQADPATGVAVVRLASAGRALEGALGGRAFAILLVQPEDLVRMHVHVGLLCPMPREFEAMPTRYGPTTALHIERSAHPRRRSPFISGTDDQRPPFSDR